jgi:SAM-dependent methyltransferase
MNGFEINAIKAAMKAVWTAGDFGRIAKFNEPAAAAFVARLGIAPGMQVLDVACGTGNLALAAARAGAEVTGIDIAPNLLDQARANARRDGLSARFDEGDAEDLPYEDASFDVVASMFGAMFAPRPARAAAELTRVCRRGGTIAMANWTPGGFIGEQHTIMARHLPFPPGMPNPIEWGDAAKVRERLGAGVTNLRMTPVMASMRFPFPVAETVEFFRTWFGPAQRAFAMLPPHRQPALRRDMEAVYGKYNRATDGTTHVEAEYLAVVATRA